MHRVTGFLYKSNPLNGIMSTRRAINEHDQRGRARHQAQRTRDVVARVSACQIGSSGFPAAARFQPHCLADASRSANKDAGEYTEIDALAKSRSLRVAIAPACTRRADAATTASSKSLIALSAASRSTAPVTGATSRIDRMARTCRRAPSSPTALRAR